MGKVQHKFKPSSTTALWKDSATKMGLTLDTINLIAEFSDTYGQSAYKITHFIAEARNIIANKYHVTKLPRHFESNNKIINHLAKKLHILFSHITSKDDHKAKLSNYAGFLINSLKRFFKWAFGKGRDETVTPKTDDRYFSGYRKRKPIKEEMPKWWKDQQAGKLRVKPSSKLLDKKNQANLDYLRIINNPKVSKDKKIELKKRVDYYDKLYNDRQKTSNPLSKPNKRTKQPKELHKTSRALQNEIQTRLRRLGEI